MAKKVVEKKKQPTPKVKVRNQVHKGPHGGMQLVLIEDVPHLGKQGELVEVKHGYGRNYLIPNSMAVLPSEHNIKLLERFKTRVQQAKEARVADLKVLAEQIHRTLRITIESKATDEGHLYGSVGPVEISKTLKGKNLMVEPEMVMMTEHIKECSQNPGIKLALGYNIEASIEVVVVPQVVGKK